MHYIALNKRVLFNKVIKGLSELFFVESVVMVAWTFALARVQSVSNLFYFCSHGELLFRMSLWWIGLLDGCFGWYRSLSCSFSYWVYVVSFPVYLFQAFILSSLEQVISYSWWHFLLFILSNYRLALTFLYPFLSWLLNLDECLFFPWALCISLLIVINMWRYPLGGRTSFINFPVIQRLIRFLETASFKRMNAPIELFFLCSSRIFLMFFSVAMMRCMVEVHFTLSLNGKR